MINPSQNSSMKRVLYSKPVLFLLGILVLFFAFGVFSFKNKLETTSENKKILENRIIELQKQKEKLSGDIEKLKTDEGIEESIRTKFGLAKEGENVIVVVDSKEVPKGGVVSKKSFWQRLLFWKK